MKHIFLILVFLHCLGSVRALAQNDSDLRMDHQAREKQQEIIREKATEELKQAKAAAAQKILEIKNDETAIKAAITSLQKKNELLEQTNKAHEQQILEQKKIQEQLRADLAESDALGQELSGFIKTGAKDLDTLLSQSLQSALTKDGQTFLAPLISQKNPWSMEDVEKMADCFFREITASGAVKITRASIIDRQGKEETARVLTLGNFTGIYYLEKADGSKKEVGFLLYSDQSRRFFALSRLPSSGMADKMRDYFKGVRPDVPMDISKGGALRQLTHHLNLAEQVPKGGPIVWPILAILGLSLIILLERLIFFYRRQIRVEPFMAKVRKLVAQGNWEDCKTLLSAEKHRLIPKILLTCLPLRDLKREDMENALQESILGEIPRIERFLSTLGMLAAIAPLLGLLGTVTGMINTFHVITYYGAGDPRMMSGGISEALVTTMLGLTVAIPIMLFHTLLSRRVETQIGQMEEKAVSFVNMVFKQKALNGKKEDA
ncbi:MAG: MotA/TolQ/ExbB proton channel family protein [Proteobacteria bacterium]|nr:MotA/TolQ/ExbB proton channel family protein [Pseudomonadota bacterium]